MLLKKKTTISLQYSNNNNSKTFFKYQSQNMTPENIGQERNILFEYNNRLRRRPASTASSTASEAVAIQQSLSRTQKLLKSELSRVAAVQNAISEDEQILRKTMEAHNNLNVAGAKRALTQLEQAKQSEQRVLMASIIFFWCSVSYILWCRIFVRLPLLDRLIALLQYIALSIKQLVPRIYTKIIQLQR